MVKTADAPVWPEVLIEPKPGGTFLVRSRRGTTEKADVIHPASDKFTAADAEAQFREAAKKDGW